MPAFPFLFSRKPFSTDGILTLRVSRRDERDEKCGIVDSYSFDIYETASKQYAGYISIRIGESPELYYLGHIGYRIEKPFRGHGYACRACRMLIPFLQRIRVNDLIITADPTNYPSVKTCLRLKCVFEQTVPVPEIYRPVCSGSLEKSRFIWQIPKSNGA